jgi:DNA polymerase-1
LDEAALLVKEPDKEGLKEIFRELEFRQLIDRIYRKVPQDQKPADINRKPKDQPDLFSQFEEENETSNGPSDKKNITLVNHQYHLMDSEEKIIKLTDLLGKNSFFTFDTETTGLNPHLAELVGIAFSLNPGEAYYVPFPESFNEAKKRSSAFKPLFENPNIEKIGQNIKYDIAVLRKYDISVKGKLFDTMIAHYLLRPDMRHNMNILSETYLDYAPIPIDTLIGKKGKGQKSIREAPLEQVCEYACEDADITLQLKDAFGPMLKKEGLLSLFNDIETPLINVLETMEHNGVSIDTDLLSALSGELEEDIRILEGEIQLLAGQSFNVDSPKQLGEVLFEMLKIDEKPKKTKTGQYSTSEDVLSKLVHKHDIIPKILDFRTLRKLKSTYVDTLPNMINPVTQRIHARFNQAVAATGRLSSDKPNLQNIPIKTQRGREVRKAFIPSSKENIILAADYSQIELRIIAELSKDPSMMEAFSNGTDIHKATAANIFGLPLSEVTRELRTKAKAVNFGISYGQTAFGLSQTLDISRKEAKEIIDNFFNKYSKIKTYMTNNIEFARSKGYVETLLGRKRYLRDINSRNAIVRGHAERNAINAPIQGTAADMIKIAMVNIHQEMAKTGIRSQLIMQVHDELVFEVHKDELEELSSLVESQMKNAIPMKVPIEIDLGTGKNWLAAH